MIMRRIRQTLSAGIFLVSIVGLAFATSQAQETSKRNLQYQQGHNQILSGKVVNAQTGQPIANAEVTIMTSGSYTDNESQVRSYGMHIETTITTDQNGRFLVKNLSFGPHTIKVRKNNYQYWQNTVSLRMGMNNYYKYNGLSSFGYYMHGYNYPYSYGYRHNNNERQPPFHGFFRPDSTATGFFHGVFSKNKTSNKNKEELNYRKNTYSKGLFLIIKLQKRNRNGWRLRVCMDGNIGININDNQ